MFDIKILGYNFYCNYGINKYPVVEMEARYEDYLFIQRICIRQIYNANLLTLPDMIKDFVDKLWKEFHKKGIPKVYEIRLYITLPVTSDSESRQLIVNEFKKCLTMKCDEDKYYRALSNMRFGLGIEPEFVPNRDIRTLLPESCYIDTDLADSIMDTIRYTQVIDEDRAKAKEKIKEYEKMKIENVIFNAPATIVFWRDGSKTVVKAKDEPFDQEKGLAMAIAKKAYGNEGNYYNEFKKFIKDDAKEDNKNE